MFQPQQDPLSTPAFHHAGLASVPPSGNVAGSAPPPSILFPNLLNKKAAGKENQSHQDGGKTPAGTPKSPAGFAGTPRSGERQGLQMGGRRTMTPGSEKSKGPVPPPAAFLADTLDAPAYAQTAGAVAQTSYPYGEWPCTLRPRRNKALICHLSPPLSARAPSCTHRPGCG